MADIHLTLELLREVHRGDRNPGDVTVLALAHIFELCPRCREVFETWRRTAGQDAADHSNAGDGEISCDEAPEPGNIKSWLADILGLPEEERRERLRDDAACSQGPRLAALLLQEGRSYLPGRLREARAIAGLARAVLQHGTASRETAILYARAVAHEGNAARALGEVEAAEDLLESARFLLQTEGCEDPVVLAELNRLEGSLRRYQGRLAEAEELLRRAAAAFSREGKTREAARALVSLGLVYFEQDDFERAIEVAQETIGPLERIGDSRTLLCVRHNLAAALSRSGRIRAARESFDDTQELYEQDKDFMWQVYRPWLDGSLNRSEGNLKAAELRLSQARQACLDHGWKYRAAVVGKDLASLFAEQGRLDQLERLVQEIVPVFEAQNVHYEADNARQILEAARSSGGPPIH